MNMTEEEFQAINDEVIRQGALLKELLDPRDPKDIGFKAVQDYAQAFGNQAIARAAMQLRREGRYSLAAQVMEGAR